MREQVLLLDGSNPGGADLGAVRTVLQAELERRGAEVRAVSLKDEALAPCRGCFGCWVATPGLCRSRDRSGPLLEAMLASTVVVLLTPATFGGYSSSAKRFVDHWIQTTLPYLRTFRGETHHPLRYRAFPRLVAVGVSDRPDPAEERLLQAIVARNGANFSAPSCSAGVVSPGTRCRACSGSWTTTCPCHARRSRRPHPCLGATAPRARPCSWSAVRRRVPAAPRPS